VDGDVQGRSNVRIWVIALVAAGALAAAAPAGAVDQNWEVEFHAGGAFDRTPDAGVGKLPDPNSLVSAPIPGAARIVPSWYFGDGALQLNQALASGLFSSISIVPLDAVLQSRLVERTAGGSVGFRAARRFSRRFSAEFTFDAANSRLTLIPKNVTGLELTRLSFANAWNTFLRGLISPTQPASSVLTTDDARGRRFTGTGSLLIDFPSRSRLTPYVAIGAGVVANTGTAPSARLTGNYRFVFPPVPVPIPGIPTISVNETDSVIVRSVVENRLTFLLGGGLRYPLGRRLGLRIDLRDHIHANPLRTELEAVPSTQPNTAGLIVGSTPRITFGSSPFLRSTLSGAPISELVTFRGTGIQHSVNVSAGVFWRF
jgi:hypothetical protein